MKPKSHLALARKHRPQLFQELVGQEAIATTLANAVESGQTAHAYLFFGPRGVGKTTTARILAKALNCAKGPTPKPCGECPSCAEIASSSSIDVLELDAASHTQVDKIREMIIETVSLAPSRDRRKIFIIDEVHMLSSSSFNALLKTLEEPPAHALFILATTELAKIPATIVSRCQRFRFRPLAADLIASHLGRLAQEEKIAAEPEALGLIARAAGGSLRDAVSLLDQAAAYAEKVTPQSMVELLGTLPEEFLLGIAKAVLSKDARSVGQWLERLAAEGYDPSQLLHDLRERLHALHLHRLGVGPAPQKSWAELAQAHPAETFSFLVRRLNQTLEDMRGDSPQLAFELGIFGMIESVYDLREWVERLQALEKGLKAPGAAPPSPAPASGPEGAWLEALKKLREEKPALAACLEGSRVEPAQTGPWKLIFDQTFKMDKAHANRAAVEGALSAAAGKDIRLDFEMAPAAPPPPPERARAAPSLEGEWLDASSAFDPNEDPAVKKVLGVLGGKVKQVRKNK